MPLPKKMIIEASSHKRTPPSHVFFRLKLSDMRVENKHPINPPKKAKPLYSPKTAF